MGLISISTGRQCFVTCHSATRADPTLLLLNQFSKILLALQMGLRWPCQIVWQLQGGIERPWSHFLPFPKLQLLLLCVECVCVRTSSNVSMHIYGYMNLCVHMCYLCMCMYMYLWIYMHVCVFMCIFIYYKHVYLCIHVCFCLCMYMRVYLCVCLCMFVYVYECIHAYVHMYVCLCICVDVCICGFINVCVCVFF